METGERRRLTGFPPVLDARTRVIVLGTMPSVLSLRAGEYYANPRNRFWRLMTDLLDLPTHASYDERIAAMGARRVGLWDVLAGCEREGSLDANIRAAEVNDFDALIAHHPDVRAFAFNGTKAASSFDGKVAGVRGAGSWRGMRLLRLPSTSPANAAADYDRLRSAWLEVLTWT
jgi:double-stranded uracil-DNA glycosylase